LHVVSLPPVVSTPLRTLRAYNATNISEQACSLAGVPRTRELDDKGDYQHAMPPACPNCDNDLFAARPNGRIDIKPGETAHLLARATGSGKYYCSTPKLELSACAPFSKERRMKFAKVTKSHRKSEVG
jgi:hypothetical protein